jgi:hypothetical protein
MPIKTPGGNQLKLIDDQKDVVGQLFDKNLSLKDAINFAFSNSKSDATLEMKKLQASKSKIDEITPEEIDKITEIITSKLSERIAFAIDEYIKETIVTIKSNIQVHVDTEIDGRKYSGEGKTTSSGTS